MTGKLIKTAGFTVLTMAISLQPLQVHAANGALMELIQILKNKGSITEEEFQLLQKAAADEQQPVATVQTETVSKPEPETTVAALKPANTSWTDKLTLKGDIRLRYQNEQEEAGIGRDRERIRYRVGITGQPVDNVEVGAGLASGPADPRSTNQSFSDSFTKKPINLDYAYAQYEFNDNLKVIGGKFKSAPYLYLASDMLWDTDINPEGASVNFMHKSDFGTTFANSGLWVLAERGASDKDTYMAYLQAGQIFAADKLFGTVAGTYYSYKDVTSLTSFPSAGSNTDFHFDSIYSLAGEIGVTDLFVDGSRFSLLGDWIYNTDTNTDADNGYLVGFKTAWHLWSFRYNYVSLDHNAWPDIFPDSDRYSGFTGIRSHEFLFEFELMKNVLLGIDYYLSEKQLTGTDQYLLQVDLNVKF